MPALFTVIAEPTRRRILDRLRTGPCQVGELVDDLGLPQPTVSKHLRVLRESGFVEVTPDAQRRRYQLRPEPLAEIDAWLTPYRWMWEHRLDLLEEHLDREAPPGAPDRTGPATPDKESS